MTPAQIEAWQRFYQDVVSRSGDWPREAWFAAVGEALAAALRRDHPIARDYLSDVAELMRLEELAEPGPVTEALIAQLEDRIAALIVAADDAIRGETTWNGDEPKPHPSEPARSKAPSAGWRQSDRNRRSKPTRSGAAKANGAADPSQSSGSPDMMVGSRAKVSGGTAPYRLREDLIITESADPKSKEMRYYIMDVKTSDVYEFGPEESFILRNLNGASSYGELVARFEAQFGFAFTDQQFAQLMTGLREIGLLESVRDEPSAEPRAPIDRGDAGAQTAPPRAVDRRAAAASGTSKPFARRLFDPERLFEFLARTLWPLRFWPWLLVPVLLLAFLILFHRSEEFTIDIQRYARFTAFWQQYLFTLFMVNLVSKLSQGTVAHAFGAPMHEFGIRLMFGVLPRFYVNKKPINSLQRSGQLWAFATPLLAKLSLFAIGTLIWIGYRQQGTWLPGLALLLGQAGLGAFLFTANPLWPSDGYRWLSAYFNEPKLRGKAVKTLGLLLRGRFPKEHRSRTQTWAVACFGAAALLYCGLVVVVVLAYLGIVLEERLRGTGVIITSVLFGMVLLWIYAMRKAAAKRRNKTHPSAIAEAPADAGVPADASWAVALGSEWSQAFEPQRPVPMTRGGSALDIPYDFPDLPRERRLPSWAKYLIWTAVAITVAVVAFLPYPYETGGEFSVLPTARTAVHAQVDGDVVSVDVREGDWVAAGQALAQLSDWDKQRDLARVRAELDKAEAQLKLVQEGAKPESIDLARREVESADVSVEYARRDAERAEELLRTGTIATAAADDARSKLHLAEARLAEARAKLTLTASGARQSEIDAAQAEVTRLRSEVRFREDQIERTKIRALSAGRVVTPNLHFMLGKYLPAGGLFAELEDNRVARVEVLIAETDVAEVEIGARVRLRPWGMMDQELSGHVVSIAPVAEEQEFGQMVRVIVEVPRHGLLKSGMTGFAKIEAAERPVWEAFTRMLVRFFQIEVWSWIP